jgi:hypothetical protein
VNPWTESKMVGHTDFRMSEERYGHLYQHALQEKIDRIGAQV